METLHIKLETEEAISSKKDLLSTEINLLKIIKNIQEYKKLRTQEISRKINLKTKLREITGKMKNLKLLLPSVKLQKEPEETIKEASRKMRLEDELKEIKEKLAKLS